MKKSSKTDSYQIDSIVEGPGGSIIIDARPTRIGVFSYPGYKQLRPEEEVFNPDSMNSLSGCTFTVIHPDSDDVNPENFKDEVRGHVIEGSVTRDGDYLCAKIQVSDKDAIDLILSKKMQELSCGYTCEEDPTSGEYNGIHYDSIQRNIVYNHLSLVQRGRAGPACRVITDEDDMKKKQIHDVLPVDSEPQAEPVEEAPAPEAPVEAPVQVEVQAEPAPEPVPEPAPEPAPEPIAEPAAAVEEPKTDKNDSIISKSVNDLVKEKLKLIDSISKLVPEDKLSKQQIIDLEPIEAKMIALTLTLPGLSLEGMSEDYINGAYDVLVMCCPPAAEEAEMDACGPKRRDAQDAATTKIDRAFKKVDKESIKSANSSADDQYMQALRNYEKRLVEASKH